MNRRSFLKRIAVPVAAAVVSTQIPLSWFGKLKNWFNEWNRSRLISRALETPEGRAALAQAMIEPIRHSVEYQAIGRKLLMIEELPQGAYARYSKDVANCI